MAAAYLAGATLEEVGRAYNVTRERVRQIIKKHGLNTERLTETSRAARREKGRAELEARLIERLSAGESPLSVARSLGVSLRVLQALGKLDPDEVALPRHERKPMPRLYSDEEILACLRQANAQLGGVMASTEYGSVAAASRLEDGRSWPGRQTAAGRFGSWRQALAAAGLPSNPSSPMAGLRQFDQSHCIDAILEVERFLGRVPSAREYDEYARTHGGLPSLATIRHRYGQWHLALTRAIEFRLDT